MNLLIAIVLIFGGSVLIQIIGALWYGPLFGKIWMRSWGKTESDLQMSSKESLRVYGLSFIAGLCTSAFLYLVTSQTGYAPGLTALSVVIIMFFLGAIVALPSYLFENRPLLMWGIHYAYVATSIGCVTYIMATLV